MKSQLGPLAMLTVAGAAFPGPRGLEGTRSGPWRTSPLALAALVAVFSAVGLPGTAFGQAESGGGFFGSGGGGGASRQTLSFTFALAGAYDSDVPVAVQSIVDATGLESQGYSTMLNGSAAYARSGRRVRLGANAASAVRHYPGLGEIRSVSHSAGLGVSADLPGRLSVSVNQTASYSPSYLYGLFPGVESAGVDGAGLGEAPPTAPDLAIDDTASIAYGTSLAVTREIGRGHSVLLRGDYRRTAFQRERDAHRDAGTYGLQGQYSFAVSRRVAMTAGYQYRAGDMGFTSDARATTTEHGIDLGMHYTRPLSSTRSAVFGFRVGSSAIDVPQTAAAGSLVGRHYSLTGEVTAGYRFRRTWDARASYRRGLEYIAELAEPVFNDGVAVAASGYLSRRLSLSMSAAFSTGESVLTSRALDFDTYTSSVNLRYAIARSVAAYGQYLYYFYDFGQGGALLPGIPPGLERHGARVGVTVWVPAIGR